MKHRKRMKAIPDVPGQSEAYGRGQKPPFKKGKEHMSRQHPSGAKARAQIQLGKALFKIYQLKTAWANRWGRKPTSDVLPGDESTTPIE
ncbi:hypothetical protein MINTM021_11710 [Mycobacterium paraintracellulare]|nr:hypothetical protein MINTM021_11710 [Mycobacterium paraintracellulare]